jgi:hypothetical protein
MGDDFAGESSMPQVLGYIALFILAWFVADDVAILVHGEELLGDAVARQRPRVTAVARRLESSRHESLAHHHRAGPLGPA